MGVRAVVPGDLQGVAALHCRPGVLGDDGDAADRLELGRDLGRVDLEHLDYAGDLHGLGIVVARHLAAEDRRAGNEGVEHPVETGIEAVHGLAGGEVLVVDGADLALADELEGFLILQGHALASGHGEFGGCRRHVAKAERALRLGMGEDRVLGLHFRCRHAPLLGGGLDQHGLRRRTRMAQVREEVAERARAVGVLVAETSFVTPGLGDLDLGPIRLELVGDDEGDGGAHALAHLRAMAGDGDGAVRRDGHEHLRVVLPAMRHGIGAEFLRLVLLVLGTRGITPGQGEHQGRPCRRAWRGG